jgi:hypothetical protein
MKVGKCVLKTLTTPGFVYQERSSATEEGKGRNRRTAPMGINA